MTDNSRETAAAIVERWLLTGDFPDRLIPPDINDRPFVMEVVYGVTKWKRFLEWVVNRFVKRKPDEGPLSLLFVGIYQLLIMDNVADHAAVNETVEAARKRGYATGFVNGVLRSVIREKDTLRRDAEKLPVAVAASHPDVLFKRWKATYGQDKAKAMCNWNNQRAEVHIFPNPLKTTCESLLALLREAGIAALPHRNCPDACLVIPHGFAVGSIPGYAEGLFSVQDASTFMAVSLLNPQPGERVLDACAAPGGKTTLIAERMSDKGYIAAMDLHSDRLPRIDRNMKRLGIKSVKSMRGDASNLDDLKMAAGDELFDRILLDVPCSNTGVLQRRPDARWRFSDQRIQKLMNTQIEILDAAATVLAPEGTIVYSTCSIEPEENRLLVESFLKRNQDLSLVKAEQLFPPESGTDGAFAAVLRTESR